MTYKDFTMRMRRMLWPSGEPSAQIPVHDRFFLLAMMEIAKECKLNQLNNTSVIPACATAVRCGLTYADAPVGVIRKVYTIANSEWCDQVFYTPSDITNVLCRSRELLQGFTNPENAGMPALQQGFKYAEPSTDSTYGRARTAWWANERQKLVIYPWLQSNESLVVEWDGYNRNWKADDIVDEEIWGPDVEACIIDFVRWKHEEMFGCDRETKRDAKEAFWGDGRGNIGSLAWLIHYDRKKREGDAVKGCCEPHLATVTETEDDDPVTPAGPTGFAIIGDFGDVLVAADQVADMVKGWNPEFIVTTGDNWYGSTNTLANLKTLVGTRYANYILGQGTATRQNFYAAIGNHDRDPVGRLEIEKDYFGFAALQDLGANEIRPFYTVTRGPVQFFFIDTGYDNSQVNQQTDYGNTATSAQAEWLRVGLLLSTAAWKVVVEHHPQYSSYHTGGTQATLTGDGFLTYTDIRWPFKLWGADLVIGGHIHWYERLEVDGLPYITNGLGGHEIATVNGALSAYSQYLYDGNFGAQKCIADCNNLQMDFYSKDGTLRESFKMTKP